MRGRGGGGRFGLNYAARKIRSVNDGKLAHKPNAKRVMTLLCGSDWTALRVKSTEDECREMLGG